MQFGEWENGEAPGSVPTSEDSFSDDTSDHKQTSRVAQGSNKDSTTSEKVKHGLLDENGEPLLVYHGRFEKVNARGGIWQGAFSLTRGVGAFSLTRKGVVMT